MAKNEIARKQKAEKYVKTVKSGIWNVSEAYSVPGKMLLKKSCVVIVMIILILFVSVAIADNPLSGGWVSLDDPNEEYAYAQLSSMENGNIMKSFYRDLQKKIVSFGQSDQDAPEDLILATYYQDDTGLTSSEMCASYISLLYDHPEYFWVSEEGITEYNGSILEIRVEQECRLSYERMNIGNVVFYQADILLNDIQNQLAEYSVLERAAVTHDVLIRDIYYDLNASMAHTLGGAFYGHRGVCTAYAKAYKYLLERQGIRCLIAAGTSNGVGHAWNLVRGEDGQYFPVDTTYDDEDIDVEISRLYFNLPMRIFSIFHTPWTPTSAEYLYPLPYYEKPDPSFFQPDGYYLDSSFTLEENLSYENVYRKLAPVCKKAIEKGKGAFAVKVSEEQKEYIISVLKVGIENAENQMNYYFDLYMQDVASEYANEFAGITGDFIYEDGILYVFFQFYRDGTQPAKVTAFADGKSIGSYASLAAAYKAMEGQTAEELTLNITMAENYYLPTITKTPSVKKISIISDTYGQAIVLTMDGAVIPVDLELCSVNLWPFGPMTLDLSGHELKLIASASIGQFNLQNGKDKGLAKLSKICADKIVIDGNSLFEIYSNMTAKHLVLKNVYSINFRGNSISAEFDLVEVENDSSEANFTYINAGSQDVADAVRLIIKKMIIRGNQGLYLGTVSGPQTITVGDVDNQGGWPLKFYINYLASFFEVDHTFVLPHIELIGECNSHIGVEMQTNTNKSLEEADRMIHPGDAVLYAPKIIPSNEDGMSVSIYYAFDLSRPNEQNLYSLYFRFSKDKNGYLRAMPYVDGPTVTLPPSVIEIEESAYEGSACEVVYIPDGCKTIGSRAFADCKNLMYVYIPESVTTIAEDAFVGSEQVYIIPFAE